MQSDSDCTTSPSSCLSPRRSYFERRVNRHQFAAGLFAVECFILMMSVIFISIALYAAPVRCFMYAHPVFFYVFLVTFIVIYLVLFFGDSLRRNPPGSYVALFLFVIIAGITLASAAGLYNLPDMLFVVVGLLLVALTIVFWALFSDYGVVDQHLYICVAIVVFVAGFLALVTTCILGACGMPTHCTPTCPTETSPQPGKTNWNGPMRKILNNYYVKDSLLLTNISNNSKNNKTQQKNIREMKTPDEKQKPLDRKEKSLNKNKKTADRNEKLLYKNKKPLDRNKKPGSQMREPKKSKKEKEEERKRNKEKEEEEKKRKKEKEEKENEEKEKARNQRKDTLRRLLRLLLAVLIVLLIAMYMVLGLHFMLLGEYCCAVEPNEYIFGALTLWTEVLGLLADFMYYLGDS